MYKTGIIVKQLDASQLGISLTMSLNDILFNNSDVDAVVYFQNQARSPISPRFATMVERELLGTSGVVISTDLRTTETLSKCPGDIKRYFYVWNLEWISMQNMNFKLLSDIYCNPDIELIARSNNHYNMITKMWKKPKLVMEDFDKEILKEIIYGKV